MMDMNTLGLLALALVIAVLVSTISFFGPFVGLFLALMVGVVCAFVINRGRPIMAPHEVLPGAFPVFGCIASYLLGRQLPEERRLASVLLVAVMVLTFVVAGRNHKVGAGDTSENGDL
jgi:hypothetical protein